MAITTRDGWFAAAKQRALLYKTATRTTVAGGWFSSFDLAGNPGAEVLERAERAAAAATSAAAAAGDAGTASASAIEEQLVPILKDLVTATRGTATLIDRNARETAQQLAHLAEIGMADRVPVFDGDGNPIRSRVDLEARGG